MGKGGSRGFEQRELLMAPCTSKRRLSHSPSITARELGAASGAASPAAAPAAAPSLVRMRTRVPLATTSGEPPSRMWAEGARSTFVIVVRPCGALASNARRVTALFAMPKKLGATGGCGGCGSGEGGGEGGAGKGGGVGGGDDNGGEGGCRPPPHAQHMVYELNAAGQSGPGQSSNSPHQPGLSTYSEQTAPHESCAPLSVSLQNLEAAPQLIRDRAMSHTMDEAADTMARVLCATTARGVERCCVARVPSGNAAMPNKNDTQDRGAT